MGTPLPPNEPGNICTVVFGTGGRFEGQTQPKIIRATFSGYVPDQAWDAGFDITLQTPQFMFQLANPCQYSVVVDDMLWFLWWRATSTIFSIEENLGAIEFHRGDVSINGGLEVPNELTTGINVATLGGVVEVDWLLGGL